MYFRKPTLKNLSQGARLEYVRRLRHMDADDVAEYFGFGGDDPHKTTYMIIIRYVIHLKNI